jgi:hypothetical protein
MSSTSAGVLVGRFIIIIGLWKDRSIIAAKGGVVKYKFW